MVEPKVAPDFLACVTSERERFYQELARARYCQGFATVVEGSLYQVMDNRHGIRPTSLLGTVAAWIRRGFPAIFVGCTERAAPFALRCQIRQVTVAERVLRACGETRHIPQPAAAERADIV